MRLLGLAAALFLIPTLCLAGPGPGVNLYRPVTRPWGVSLGGFLTGAMTGPLGGPGEARAAGSEILASYLVAQKLAQLDLTKPESQASLGPVVSCLEAAGVSPQAFHELTSDDKLERLAGAVRDAQKGLEREIVLLRHHDVTPETVAKLGVLRSIFRLYLDPKHFDEKNPDNLGELHAKAYASLAGKQSGAIAASIERMAQALGLSQSAPQESTAVIVDAGPEKKPLVALSKPAPVSPKATPLTPLETGRLIGLGRFEQVKLIGKDGLSTMVKVDAGLKVLVFAGLYQGARDAETGEFWLVDTRENSAVSAPTSDVPTVSLEVFETIAWGRVKENMDQEGKELLNGKFGDTKFQIGHDGRDFFIAVTGEPERPMNLLEQLYLRHALRGGYWQHPFALRMKESLERRLAPVLPGPGEVDLIRGEFKERSRYWGDRLVLNGTINPLDPTRQVWDQLRLSHEGNGAFRASRSPTPPAGKDYLMSSREKLAILQYLHGIRSRVIGEAPIIDSVIHELIQDQHQLLRRSDP